MINDLADLKKLLQLLRKQGVTDFEFDKIKLKMGDLPQDNVSDEVDINKQIDDVVGMNSGFEGIDPLAFYSADSRLDQQ